MEIIQERTRNEVSCGRKNLSAGELSFHWHENYEICLVEKNSCRFRVDGEIIHACEGDIIFINEQTVHQFIIDSDDTIITVFQFSPKLFINLQAEAKPLKTHISAEEKEAVPQLGEKLNMLFELLETEKNIADNLFVQGIVIAIYYLLKRYFEGEELVKSEKNERREFYKIATYINKHFKEDINVNSLARELYFSRGKISAIFKKYSGSGINEYTNMLRVNNAKSLMKEGVSVTEAALESGFQSIRTFNNVYKKLTGMSPSEYLKAQN